MLIYCKYDANYGNPKDKFIKVDNSREIFEAATDECIFDPQKPSDDGAIGQELNTASPADARTWGGGTNRNWEFIRSLQNEIIYLICSLKALWIKYMQVKIIANIVWGVEKRYLMLLSLVMIDS